MSKPFDNIGGISSHQDVLSTQTLAALLSDVDMSQHALPDHGDHRNFEYLDLHNLTAKVAAFHSFPSPKKQRRY